MLNNIIRIWLGQMLNSPPFTPFKNAAHSLREKLTILSGLEDCLTATALLPILTSTQAPIPQNILALKPSFFSNLVVFIFTPPFLWFNGRIK